MLKHTLLASLLALTSASAFAAAETYAIDGSHTQANFTWTHFGFSNPTGGFDNIAGTITYDADHPEKSSVEVTIGHTAEFSGTPAHSALSPVRVILAKRPMRCECTMSSRVRKRPSSSVRSRW